MNLTTSHEAPTDTTARKPRRTDGLVGNGLVLSGVVLSLCEFIGIIASHVHTMPTVPGAGTSLSSTYARQAGATGFLVGWYSLVLPGRVLLVLGLRQALLCSAADRLSAAWRTVLAWSVVLMAIGVVVELTSAALDAGAAAATGHGDQATVFALDRVAHYLLVTLYTPSGLATVIVGLASWRAGVLPRVLVAIFTTLGAVQVLSGTLLSGPSTASLQDGLTVLNLLSFVTLIWLGVLVFRHRPRALTPSAA